MLKLLGNIYGRIATVRNSLYDRGVLKSHSLGARTISIGNITTGGTGKTPLVAFVAEILADAGEKVCILTRGYGREKPRRQVLVSDGKTAFMDPRTGGDEPLELARKLLGKAAVVAGADRVSAAAWAKEKFGITAFVLDDAFQHRRAKRDLDIVCIDATNPFGNGMMLPGGALREPVENLSRADAFVLTRCDLVDDLRELTSKIKALNPDAEIFRSRYEICVLTELAKFLERESGESQPSQDSSSLAFCGLGNPDTFFQSVGKAGYRVKATQAYRDHHYYTQPDIDTLERRAREQEIDVLMTTAKDAVKLREFEFSLPCYVVEVQVEIDDATAFRKLVISS